MCVVQNTFYNQELRIVSQKRSWNKQLKFGTRARGATIDLSIYTNNIKYINRSNLKLATNQ